MTRDGHSNQPDVYTRLGVPTLINAKGPATRLGGGIMAPEVADAMREATQHCVDMATLQSHASDLIAGITGAEAGIVTAGAAAAVLAGTAACVAGMDPACMSRLPDVRGMKDEVVVVRSQRNFYDHAVRAVGVRLVEVGLADRYAGSGVRDAEPWEIADALSERTACVYYMAHPRSRPPLADVVRVAHAAGIPVLLDAAAQLPPAENLRHFLDLGADLVAFSGGKAIGGPQGSGILCGRRDLVASAALQTLDMDLYREQWAPGGSLFADLELDGLPPHGIGRTSKVGKEEVVGLLVALQRFADGGAAADRARAAMLCADLRAGLGPLLPDGASLSEAHPEEVHVDLRLIEGRARLGALDLMLALERGRPGIHADPTLVDEGVVRFATVCLAEGEPEVIAAQVGGLLRGG